ncbi:hypothetical protein COO60DRAFT_856358 [Scenedesmus sp. NREL 46B-D3]|nr:hypothetical protein COO60DRAFT_856358 [Scenedesmus sp. NREL 46B-D3]
MVATLQHLPRLRSASFLRLMHTTQHMQPPREAIHPPAAICWGTQSQPTASTSQSSNVRHVTTQSQCSYVCHVVLCHKISHIQNHPTLPMPEAAYAGSFSAAPKLPRSCCMTCSRTLSGTPGELNTSLGCSCTTRNVWSPAAGRTTSHGHASLYLAIDHAKASSWANTCTLRATTLCAAAAMLCNLSQAEPVAILLLAPYSLAPLPSPPTCSIANTFSSRFDRSYANCP